MSEEITTVERTSEDVKNDIEKIPGAVDSGVVIFEEEPQEPAEKEPETKPDAKPKEIPEKKEGHQEAPEGDAKSDKEKKEGAEKDAKPATDDKPLNKPAENKEENLDETGDKAAYRYAQMRIENKEYKDRIERMEAESREASKAPTAAEQQANLAADDVFKLLMKAEREEFTKEGQNENVMKYARLTISKELSADQLFEVHQKALDGQFGEDSQAVADLATQFLPLAQQREKHEQAQANVVSEETQKEIELTRADFPEILESDSEFNKVSYKWDREYIGTIDKGRIVKPGRLGLEASLYLIKHPHVHATMVSDFIKLGYSAAQPQVDPEKDTEKDPKKDPPAPKNDTELKKAKARVAQLEKELKLQDAPEGGSAPIRTTETRSKEDIKNDLVHLSDSLE